MSSNDHYHILKQGKVVWNQWREDNPDVTPTLLYTDIKGIDLSSFNLGKAILMYSDLSDSNLSHANLSGAFLIHANLSNANMQFADLSSVSLQSANLSKAILHGANLSLAQLDFAILTSADLSSSGLIHAYLYKADLSNANISGTHLNVARFMQTILEMTNFKDAVMNNTLIANTDLSNAIGLDSVKHFGPSTIGIDTIMQSKGNIPESFLRGCGITDSFITYIKSLTTDRSIEYFSCFISYSSKDRDFAVRLHNDLQAGGVRCWFAPSDLKIGDKFRSVIDHSIHVHDKLLIILSENSLTSPWVEKEVETAFEDEQKLKKPMLFPIRLDNSIMETDAAWAADIRRTRHIGDFTQWKNQNSYKIAFEQLLSALTTRSS